MRERTLTIGALAAVAALAVPGAASGQMMDDMGPDAEDRVTFDASGGVGVPAADLADVTDVGPAVGLGASYLVNGRLAIRLDGDAELLDGAEFGTEPLPDMNLYHYNAGIAFDLAPAETRWDVAVNVAGGATTINGDDIVEADGTVELEGVSETYPAANGGLTVGYDVTRHLDVFVGGQWYVTFADEEDTQALADLVGEDGFDTLSSVPLTAGFEIKM